MKKQSYVVRKKKEYKISILINDTALIEDGNRTGLLNIKNNAILGSMDQYYTYYDDKAKFYIQTVDKKTATNEAKNLVEKKTVRVYDALNEVMICEDVEFVKWLSEYNDSLCFKTSDGFYHIFDKKNSRSNTSVVNIPFDEVKFFYKYCSESYAVVTKNGKKGLFKVGSGLITDIIYDDIEKLDNIVVYTKAGKKFFICDAEHNMKSIDFERIEVDKNNKNIVYCYNGPKTYIYNTAARDLLLTVDVDSVEFVYKSGDSYNEYNGEYFFKTFKNGKYGIKASKMTYEERKKDDPKPTIRDAIDCKYDEINKSRYGSHYYIRLGNLWGICIDGNPPKTLDPKFNDIDYIEHNLYLVEEGNKKKIIRFSSYYDYEELVTDIDEFNVGRRANIFKKGNKYGLIYTDSDNCGKVFDEFDSIKNVGEHYFIVEKDGKKGVIHLGEYIIPMNYTDIAIGGNTTIYSGLNDSKEVYFALQKDDGEYELAKRDNYNYRSSNKDCPVSFVSNHSFKDITFLENIMILRDLDCAFIYDYQEKLLRKEPISAEVTSFIRKNENGFNKDIVYLIDGKYFFYKDGKFEEIPNEELDCFVTSYESDEFVFEAKSFNKAEHDCFVEEIDALEEVDALNSLLNFAEKKNELKRKYPTLKLVKITKE